MRKLLRIKIPAIMEVFWPRKTIIEKEGKRGLIMNTERAIKMITKGVAEVIQSEELISKLAKKNSLSVKLGFDPNVPDIHLGHAVVLRKMRQLQDLGHEIIIVIGDFTAQIGDPTGKHATRLQMTHNQTLENAKTYKDQIFKILDPHKTIVRFNSEWLQELGAKDIIDLCSKYTVARILEREDFKNRLTNQQPLSLHELIYPLLQGYDSVELRADIEIGGTEQKFNILVGRYLQKEYGQDPQVAILMPLLVGTDGTQKMSKSLNNYIGINEPAKDIFGKVMSIPDTAIVDYYELATDEHPDEISKIKEALRHGRLHPMKTKMQLAWHITKLYHNEEEADRAKEYFITVFKQRSINTSDINLFELDLSQFANEGIWVPKLLKSLGMVESTSEGMRLLQAGAVKINNIVVKDMTLHKIDDEDIVSIGRKRIVKLKIKNN